jgi:hypothetical protein
MREFFSSGHAVDMVLAVLALEVAAFRLLRRPGWINALVAAAPGACLLLALRSALTGQDWLWTALWLALSLPFHLADLWRRPP